MIPVKPHIAQRAHVQSLSHYEGLYRESLANPAGFWSAQSDMLTWFHKPETTLQARIEDGEISWFAGGKLNACYNCVDRHAEHQPDKTAIIWVANEPGEYRRISYAELAREVGRMANVLKAHGVRRGDRVAIYMPMIPEIAYAMLACARIGAVHSVVFAGFSADALRDRILDADCAVVLTANEGLRGSKSIPLKAVVDDAVEGLSLVRSVIVAKRTDAEVNMKPGRDHWLADALAKERATCPVEWMDAEDPLFVLYTSGSTGKPKGLLHTTGGYMVYASFTHKHVFDIHDDDVYFCAADAGWITGHSYIV
ncbi:MAG: AMP-binding protein, partial [Myxococcales bacterium]|nr:AMP-binding protein [Myxococcales bacterium]